MPLRICCENVVDISFLSKLKAYRNERCYINNIFITNHRCKVVIGFNLNSKLKLLFYLSVTTNNNLPFTKEIQFRIENKKKIHSSSWNKTSVVLLPKSSLHTINIAGIWNWNLGIPHSLSYWNKLESSFIRNIFRHGVQNSNFN